MHNTGSDIMTVCVVCKEEFAVSRSFVDSMPLDNNCARGYYSENVNKTIITGEVATPEGDICAACATKLLCISVLHWAKRDGVLEWYTTGLLGEYREAMGTAKELLKKSSEALTKVIKSAQRRRTDPYKYFAMGFLFGTALAILLS